MSKIKPIDKPFMLLQNSRRQKHMTANHNFKLPARKKHSYVAKLLKTIQNT